MVTDELRLKVKIAKAWKLRAEGKTLAYISVNTGVDEGCLRAWFRLARRRTYSLQVLRSMGVPVGDLPARRSITSKIIQELTP